MKRRMLTQAYIPTQYRDRFEQELLDLNVGRILGFAIYVVILQIVLQITNIIIPQGTGEGMEIPLMLYIALSLLTLVMGIVYWVLLTLARKDVIKDKKTKSFLVYSMLYLYYVIQMAFCTLNILSHQGVNGQVILILLFGMIPILKPKVSIISILVSFAYTLLLLFFTQGIVDAGGKSAWQKLFETDMRAYFFIINGLTILISVFIYRLYVSNFLKSMQLEDTNIRLEELVKERTHELEKEILIAGEAYRAKTRFLTGVSHEIRTPLNTIIGMTYVAKKAESKAKVDSSLEAISTASVHLLGIINDVLDMSNLESGRLQLFKNDFPLKKMLEDLSQSIEGRCNEKGIAFRNNLNDLPEQNVSTDKLRLKQLLTNILGNAIKFTDTGGKVELKVHKTAETEKDLVLEFEIIDNGVGIEQKQLGKLFTAFEQGSLNSMKPGGTGLGLAISQNLALLMGSEIKVMSTIGKGSTFSFKVRMEKASPQLDNEPIPVEAPNLKGKRILSVEDMEINRLVLSEILAETGAELEEAADGLEALAKFEASAAGYYDFIFMDLLMPKMDGHEATRRIRALARPDAATVPIVALSANAFPDDIERALAAGMDCHLAKPVDYNAVMRNLTERLT